MDNLTALMTKQYAINRGFMVIFSNVGHYVIPDDAALLGQGC